MRLSLFVLVLALAASGCLGDGPDVVRGYFHTNSFATCELNQLSIDLETSDFEFLTDSGGKPRCRLLEKWQDEGCELELREYPEDQRLVVTIDNCRMDAQATLVQCDFVHLEEAELSERTSAFCSCSERFCTTTPKVCVNGSADGDASCENCRNWLDDDGNGDADCEDEYCSVVEFCEVPTTTEAPSTTSSSTTSSTLEPFVDCQVAFELGESIAFSTLRWTVDYSRARGRFVECEGFIPHAIREFTDAEDEELLTAYFLSPFEPFQGPLLAAECRMRGAVAPEVNDFVITVTEARDPDSLPTAPLPEVFVNRIDCSSAP